MLSDVTRLKAQQGQLETLARDRELMARAHAGDPRLGAGRHRHRRRARHRVDEPLGAAHVRRRPGRVPRPADRAPWRRAEADHPFRQNAVPRRAVRRPGRDLRVPRQGARRARVLGRRQRRRHRAASDGGRQLTYALLDIERRRQAEARSAEAQASLQRVIEMAPLAIALRDARTLRVLQLNQVAARHRRRSRRSELIGRTPEEMHPRRRRPPSDARRHAERAALAGEVTEARVRHRRATASRGSGTRATCRWRAPGEAPDQLLLVATDVTEQRAAAGGAARGGDRAARDAGQGSAPPHQEQPAGRGRAAAADRRAQARGRVGDLRGGRPGAGDRPGLRPAGRRRRAAARWRSVVEAITGSVQRDLRPGDRTAGSTAPGVADWALPEGRVDPDRADDQRAADQRHQAQPGGDGAGDEGVDCALAGRGRGRAHRDRQPGAAAGRASAWRRSRAACPAWAWCAR